MFGHLASLFLWVFPSQSFIALSLPSALTISLAASGVSVIFYHLS
jgi:hypothetical protein